MTCHALKVLTLTLINHIQLLELQTQLSVDDRFNWRQKKKIREQATHIVSSTIFIECSKFVVIFG
jgi:hypothetical protein